MRFACAYGSLPSRDEVAFEGNLAGAVCGSQNRDTSQSAALIRVSPIWLSSGTCAKFGATPLY
jgi:hypothetical protein